MFPNTGTETTIRACDDCCSSVLTIPPMMLYGQSFTSVTVSSNALIIFGGACVSDFVPTAFPVTSQPVIAVYWTDSDLRPGK